MSKALLILNIIFIFIAFVALIPLTIEVFGSMNPDVIIISARIMQVALIGAFILSIIRAVNKSKRK